MILLFGGDGTGLATGLLTEHVRVDDIGQGQTQIIGAIRVSDFLFVERTVAGATEISQTEHVRVRDTLSVGRVDPVVLTGVTVGIQMGFHASSYRDTLINESFCVAVWPLADINGTTFRDIVGGHHATLNGTGLVTGVPFALPEGGMGVTANGNQFISVPDDSAANANLNLSLANGDINQSILIKTTHNSATLRCIMCKQVTDSSGNGWYLGHQSGAVVWYLEVAGSTIFNFSRGFVSDGLEHLITPVYDTAAGEAWIEIDGVQSGAKVTGLGTEPAVTNATMRFFMFQDGVAGDGSGFIGSACYAMLGREGDDQLGARLDPCRDWTDISRDVRSVVPLVISYGIQGSRPVDHCAHTGTCTFGLDNSAHNSAGTLGYYSLDHPDKRTSFRKGAPFRVVFTFEGISYYKHVGRMVSALSAPGQNLERITRVTSADWMDVAASSRLRLPAQTGIDSDAVMGLIIDEALRPPHAVDISPGAETFDYALHMGIGGRESIMSEAARCCESEFGVFYVKGDQSQGGVVTFEGRPNRQIDMTALATFTNSMAGLTPNETQKPNLMLITVHPAVVGDTPEVLFAMTARQPIPPGEAVQILVDYRDPDNAAIAIAGDDIITPVVVTDYTMTAAEDGLGVNLNAFATIDETGAELGGTNAVLTVTNSSGQVGWFTTQIRGTAIRHEDPVTIPVGEDAVIRADGPTEETMNLAYNGSREFAQSLGEHILALYEAGRVSAISFIANTSAELMTQALAREPGDRIEILETMQSGNVAHAYVINHVELEVTAGNIIRCTWTLGPVADIGAVWLLGVAGSSEMGETTVLGL